MPSLLLRDLNKTDGQLYLDLYCSSQVMTHLGGALNERSAQNEFAKFLSSDSFQQGRLIQVIEKQKAPVGIICATKAKNKNVWDLGMLLKPSYQNLGIGRKVMNKMMDFLVANYQILEFSGTIPHNNLACIKMIESLGFMKKRDSDNFSHWLLKRS